MNDPVFYIRDGYFRPWADKYLKRNYSYSRLLNSYSRLLIRLFDRVWSRSSSGGYPIWKL